MNININMNSKNTSYNCEFEPNLPSSKISMHTAHTGKYAITTHLIKASAGSRPSLCGIFKSILKYIYFSCLVALTNSYLCSTEMEFELKERKFGHTKQTFGYLLPPQFVHKVSTNAQILNDHRYDENQMEHICKKKTVSDHSMSIKCVL